MSLNLEIDSRMKNNKTDPTVIIENRMYGNVLNQNCPPNASTTNKNIKKEIEIISVERYNALKRLERTLKLFMSVMSVIVEKVRLMSKAKDVIAIIRITSAETSHPGPVLFNKIIHIISKFETRSPIDDLYIPIPPITQKITAGTLYYKHSVICNLFSVYTLLNKVSAYFHRATPFSAFCLKTFLIHLAKLWHTMNAGADGTCRSLYIPPTWLMPGGGPSFLWPIA